MPSAAELRAYAQQQRSAARLAMEQAQHMQAQRSWDILLALDPADAEAKAGHAQASAALRAGAAERLARARAAQARGDTEGAVRQYLEALALEPDNAAPAQALRSLEHQRAQRNKPLSFARSPVLPSGPAEAAPASTGRAPSLGANAEAAELEHAALLAGQGELEAAIALLTPLLQPGHGAVAASTAPAANAAAATAATAVKPTQASAAKAKQLTPTQTDAAREPPAAAARGKGGNDAAIRASLADYHFLLAQRWAASNPTAARDALAHCLRLAPQHPEGRALWAKLEAGKG